MDSTQVQQWYHRISKKMAAILQGEIQTMLNMGVIEPTNSEQARVIAPAPKRWEDQRYLQTKHST